jgi:hypothetical protein
MTVRKRGGRRFAFPPYPLYVAARRALSPGRRFALTPSPAVREKGIDAPDFASQIYS